MTKFHRDGTHNYLHDIIKFTKLSVAQLHIFTYLHTVQKGMVTQLVVRLHSKPQTVSAQDTSRHQDVKDGERETGLSSSANSCCSLAAFTSRHPLLAV